MKNERPDLKIIGNNSASGGRYDNAKVIGNGLITGDLDCATFKGVGDSRLQGNLKAGTAKITGSLHVDGKAEIGDMRVTGDLDLDGDFHARHCHLRGRFTTKAGVRADDLSLMGHITVKKNCEAESFNGEGQIRIDGLLNADRIEIKTYGPSRISEIGGDSIDIGKGSAASFGKIIKVLFVPSNWGNAMLTVNSIEGDDIRLSSTRARVVRGNNVVIESGCEIDLVEYTGSLRVNHGSTVKEKKKI